MKIIACVLFLQNQTLLHLYQRSKSFSAVAFKSSVCLCLHGVYGKIPEQHAVKSLQRLGYSVVKVPESA